jgi:hypothetical protein
MEYLFGRSQITRLVASCNLARPLATNRSINCRGSSGLNLKPGRTLIFVGQSGLDDMNGGKRRPDETRHTGPACRRNLDRFTANYRPLIILAFLSKKADSRERRVLIRSRPPFQALSAHGAGGLNAVLRLASSIP